jgi:hypothetical protein
MTIQNLELTSIEGKRFVRRDEPIHQLNINSNSSITLVNQINDGEAEIEFRYTVNYMGVGFIKVEGRLIFKGEAPTLAADWSAKRNMPDKVAQELHSAIMGACIPETVVLARDLNLTLPIPLPKIDLKKAKGQTGGEVSGMEVA